MSGSENAQYLKSIITKVEGSGLVQGAAPGAFALQIPQAAPVQGAAAGEGPLNPGEAALVRNAISLSNDSATPAAAPGAGAIASAIDAIAHGLTQIANTPADVKALVAGAAAKLHWWGWTLQLNESATQALSSLLKNDLAGLVMIATTLASASPPLAATAAILTAVAGGLSGWIAAEDQAQKGVVIHGYLWVGIWVQPAA